MEQAFKVWNKHVQENRIIDEWVKIEGLKGSFITMQIYIFSRYSPQDYRRKYNLWTVSYCLWYLTWSANLFKEERSL